MTIPATTDVLGEQLHEGSIVIDLAGGEHRIDHFAEYPGRFVGDHARVAYYTDGGERTVADHEHFHCLPELAAVEDDRWRRLDEAARAFETETKEAA